jgi:hypothetical protein
MDKISKLCWCKICNKKYSSYKSLWNHNKKFHNIIVSKLDHTVSNITQNVSKQNISSLNCKFCNKILSTAQNRWKHENKVCKKKINENNKFKEIEEQNKQHVQTINGFKLCIETELLLKEENKKLKEELKNINLTKIKEDINDIKK